MRSRSMPIVPALAAFALAAGCAGPGTNHDPGRQDGPDAGPAQDSGMPGRDAGIGLPLPPEPCGTPDERADAVDWMEGL